MQAPLPQAALPSPTPSACAARPWPHGAGYKSPASRARSHAGQVPEVTLSRVPRLTALEHDFPAAALSQLAEHESWRKEVHRPATCTHKWWAKRLGTVFRGILCSAVTHDEISAMEACASAARLDGLTVFDP